MAGTSVPSISVPCRWRLRFSLRTLVLGVLIYASLWTVTELFGGRDFKVQVETERKALQRATAVWARNEVCEANLWAEESAAGFGEDLKFVVAETQRAPAPACPGSDSCRSSGAPGVQTDEAGVRSF